MKVVGRLKAVLGLDTKKFNKGVENAKKKTSSFGKNINKIGGIIAGAFAVDKIISFGKAIVQTTAQFQKFNAVLTQTLGSKGEARRAMNDIVEFASKTPFQVEELTDSFVKMANRGMKPTMSEMRSLGDLAAATGKTFDQLAEASLDAVVGEFERLKEFGIKARREGDKVNFTFKGQTTTVENTEKAIKDYIISLGNAQGVQGSMNAISKTTGGRISNMKDQWTQFLNTLGSRSTGIINGVIKALTKMVSMFNNAAKSIQQVKQEVLDKNTREAIEGDRKEVKELAKRYKEIGIEADGMTLQQKAANDILKQYRNLLQSLGPEEKNRKNRILAQIDALENMAKAVKKVNEETEKTKKGTGIIRDPFASGMAKKGSKAGGLAGEAQPETPTQLANMEGIIAKNKELRNQLQLNQQEVNLLGNIAQNAFQGMSNSLQQALNDGKNILDSFGKFFLDMLKSLIIKLTAAAATAAVLAALLGGTTIAGSFGMQAGGGFGSNFGAAFGQLGGFGMARGGIVPPGFPNDSYPAMLTSGEKVIPPRKLDSGKSKGYIAETSIDLRRLNIKLKENDKINSRFE
jgi:phage tail tape-measure protein